MKRSAISGKAIVGNGTYSKLKPNINYVINFTPLDAIWSQPLPLLFHLPVLPEISLAMNGTPNRDQTMMENPKTLGSKPILIEIGLVDFMISLEHQTL
jgi:hypothetical protein